MAAAMDPVPEKALQDDKKKLMEHKETESLLKEKREQSKDLAKQDDKSEYDLKIQQCISQIMEEVLEQPSEKDFIFMPTKDRRCISGYRRNININYFKPETGSALDLNPLTIMRYLPCEIDPLLFNMSYEDLGDITYSAIGGLKDQIYELRDVIEYPLRVPKIFKKTGTTPPKGCLLYGPPGTGKKLLVRALANQIDANLIKVVLSAIVDKSIGKSFHLIREMFKYALFHQPCIIFVDGIDAIGSRRFPEGTSADRKIQKMLIELLNQIDKVNSSKRVKIIMATNRPDTLDRDFFQPERLNKKIEIPLPNEPARLEILKIHAPPNAKYSKIDYEAVAKLSNGFSGADLKNVCSEAELCAKRFKRPFIVQQDFMKAVRKVSDNKKLESKLNNKPA